MALAAGPKLKARPINLDGLPDDFRDRAMAFLDRAGINVYGWQEPVLRDLIAADRPRVAYVQTPRKCGKTRLAAMVGLCELVLKEGRHCYAVSDSERNLHSVLWLELCSLINGSDLLNGRLHIFQPKVENPHNGSFLELRAGNFMGSQGLNGHLVLANEVHLINPEVFHGYQMSGAARDDALLLGTTTPGYELSGVAFDLYETAKAGTDAELYSRLFEPDDPQADIANETAWHQASPVLAEANGSGFLKALRYDLTHLPEHEFRRFRMGQWTTTKEAWLPYGSWQTCSTKRKLKAGEEVWLGFDGSFSGDSTALVACTKDGHLEVLGHWAKPSMGSADWRVDIATVEQAIREACQRYNVMEIAADPARWSRSLQQLEYEGLPVVEMPQSPARMIPATARFFDAMLDRKLTHSGGKGLTTHMSNCVVTHSASGVMVAKEHPHSPRKIDLAVAAILSHDRATRAVERAPFEMVWLSWSSAMWTEDRRGCGQGCGRTVGGDA